MRPVPDSWSVVILGRWNTAIFNPAWLGQHLFEKPEVQVEFSMSPGAPPRFTAGLVRIVPQNAVITIQAVEPTQASLQRVEQVSCRMLDLLQHTPVTAVGINFSFLEKAPDESLLKNFPDAIAGSLSDQGFEIQHHTHLWQLRKSGQTVNVVATVKPDSVQFDFNFHTDAVQTSQARAAIDGRVATHLTTARGLLDTIFDLTEDT